MNTSLRLRGALVGVALLTGAALLPLVQPTAVQASPIPLDPNATTPTPTGPVPVATTAPRATAPAATAPAATAAPATAPAPTPAPATTSAAATTKPAAQATKPAAPKSAPTKPVTTKASVAKAAATTKPATTKPPTATTKPAARRNAAGQWAPNGKPPGAAALFSANPGSTDKSLPSAPDAAAAFSKVQPDGKPLYLLIIGSDARPKEKVDRSRADAIHLFAYNPATGAGALVGFPRDTLVAPPGGKARKVTELLSTQGPDVLTASIANLLKVPVNRYVVTGFDGFTKMVDGVGGIPLQIGSAMNDKASGAQFQVGWFQMNGEAALAFSRARKGLPQGDISRSANQEKFLLATLAQYRATTTNVADLLRWVKLGRQYITTNVKAGDWVYLAQVARNIEPARLRTTIVPGSPKTVNGASVVVADPAAIAALSKDLADGMLGN
jgi:polyisoprenyl-teichoic acid--peptidoglycan teichoic acid transferase